MYKFYSEGVPVPGYANKIILIMKYTFLLLIIPLLQVSATTNAQMVTLSKKNAPLEDIFRDLRRQTNYDFLYSSKQLANAKKVSIDIKNASITQVLDLCFRNQPFTYGIENRTITIKERKDPGILDRFVDYLFSINVRGRIIDEKDQPLANASILIKGTTRKTVSDERGWFVFNDVSEDALLTITYIGYEAREVTAKSELGEIALVPLEAKLEAVDIVSTGYQEIPKERATGSFTVIDNKTLDRAVSSDLLSRLKGVTNGLLFDNNVGNSTGISVRGRSTIFSNTTPLIIVDNFPFEGDINTLNPDVIENVTILKDAAAASIWGVRAGNGVVVINTKKGKFNAAPKVSINANLTIGDKPDLYHVPQLTSSQYIDIEKFLFDRGAYTATINNGFAGISPVVAILQKIKLDPSYAEKGYAEIDALRNIDVRDQLDKYFYRTSSIQHYSADVTGGGKNQSYYFSAGYDKNAANSVANTNDRITLKGNNNYSLFNDRLKINTDITFSKSKSDNTNIYDYTPFSPYDQIADADGNALATIRRGGGFSASYIEQQKNTGLLDWNYRPLDELRNKTSTQYTYLTDYRLNLGLNYKVIKPLTFSLNYQYYSANTKAETTHDRDSYYVRNMVNSFTNINVTTGLVTRPVPYGGVYSPHMITRQSNYGRAQFNFSQFFHNKHEVSAIAGYEIRDDNSKRNMYTVYGYRPETGTSVIIDPINLYPYYYNPASTSRIIATTDQWSTVNRYISFYGNASYSYDDRYIVSGSYRKDESNLFGVKANQKGVPLWSTGLAWNIHKESFFQIDWLSSLQLKATFGYNGNVNNSISAYLTASAFNYNPYAVLAYQIVNPPNDNLKWERVKNTNVGLYFASKNNRITGSMEFYVKNGIDLIGSSPIAPQTGISLFTGNVANTNAKGIDIQLNTKIIDRLFKWNSTLIFNYVKDKITDYKISTGANSSIVTGSTYSLSPMLGYPVNAIFAYKWAGLNASGNPQGYINDQVSVDYAAIRNSADRSQLQYFGSATPTVFGSLRNTLSYGKLELSFNIIYKLGYYFRGESLSNASVYSGTYIQRNYDKRWQNPGDELTTDVPALIYPNVSNRSDFYTYSAALVERGDHIRLQDIQLNYSLSKTQFPKLPFYNINIYVYTNNLGLLWRENKQGIDPDFRIGYPNPRTIAFGLRTNF